MVCWRGGSYWGRGLPGSGDPVGDDGGEARGEGASSLMDSCLASEVCEVES